MKNENGEGAGISFVIMPMEILQDKSLTSSEKILYCYLSLFKKGVCFQSNDKLAEMTGLDESTIKRGLKKLSEMQYVYVEFLNNNSAMRRIYVVLDNPKKLAYLSRKGMFRTSMSPTSPEQKNEEPNTKPTVSLSGGLKEECKYEYTTGPTPEPILDISSMKMPKRADYSSDEEYEKAFYAWNSRVIM